MAGFGFAFWNDASCFYVKFCMRIDWKGENPPGQGTGPTEIRFWTWLGFNPMNRDFNFLEPVYSSRNTMDEKREFELL